jgi:hypothetical protein
VRVSLLLVIAAIAGISGCSKKEEPVAALPAAQSAAPMAAPIAAPAIQAAIPAAPMANKGKVLQLQQAAGYTYAKVEVDGQKIWVAGGPITIKVGDIVEWGNAAVMQNFTAKSLGRTFESILFVNAWGPEGAAKTQVAPHGNAHSGLDPAALQPPSTAPLVASKDNSGQVKSVTQSGEYTYLEITQAKGSLWVAAPATPLKVGDKVVWEGDMVMRDFQSKTLNRKFDVIVFATRVALAK